MVRNAHFDDRFYNPRDPRLYRRRVRIRFRPENGFLIGGPFLCFSSRALRTGGRSDGHGARKTLSGWARWPSADRWCGSHAHRTNRAKGRDRSRRALLIRGRSPGTYQIEPVSSGLHAQQTITVEAHKVALLPPGAIVINTARGGLIVDDDLIAALNLAELQRRGWMSSRVNRN